MPNHPDLCRDYGDPTRFYRKSDSKVGITSARLHPMIPIINQTLVGDGERWICFPLFRLTPGSNNSG